jgi:hypothetical protein
MLGSPLLGTAVGLVLLFATTALLCSGITESVSNIFQMRAKYLLTGIRAMLDAPQEPGGTKTATGGGTTAATGGGTTTAGGAYDLNEKVKDRAATDDALKEVRRLTPSDSPPSNPILTAALFASPLLRSLQSRRINGVGKLRNPQYVSGRTFAKALVDLLVPADPQGAVPVSVEIGKLRTAVQKLPTDLPLRGQLLAFLARTDTTVVTFEHAVEQWYDEQMAKMAGWYKRWARVVLGVVGFLVAVAINVDTVQVAHSLYVDAPLQQAVVATANAGTLCQGETDPGNARCAWTTSWTPCAWPASRSAIPAAATRLRGSGAPAGRGRTQPRAAGGTTRASSRAGCSPRSPCRSGRRSGSRRCRSSVRCATPAPSRRRARLADRRGRGLS